MDDVTGLSVAMQANPGCFALLVGSGCSKDAGIMTGWEVLEDLIRKVAEAEGEGPLDDPEAWYRERFGEPPSYSLLLARLGATAEARRGILAGYFEPTDDERERGVKFPGDAHHAIASLVKSGHVKVVVTTNFDPLIETALRDAGLHPVVISTEHAADGARPLQHAGCVILKVNGDYLDADVKNTEEELTEYGPAMTALIDRVFDEYGLVVVGWSGKWDLALIERLQARDPPPRGDTSRLPLYVHAGRHLNRRRRSNGCPTHTL